MFKLISTDDGRVPPLDYLPCGAITPTAGMALIQTDGNLAVAAGTNKPTYISAVTKTAACAAGDVIPVYRVQPDMLFETANSEAFEDVARGGKVTLHASNGLQVTATAEGGVAEVIDFEASAASAANKRVLVRFT